MNFYCKNLYRPSHIQSEMFSDVQDTEVARPATSFMSKRPVRKQKPQVTPLSFNQGDLTLRPSTQSSYFSPTQDSSKFTFRQRDVKVREKTTTMSLHFDPERLQEELLKTRKELNQQREENNKLKTKVLSCEEEISRLSKPFRKNNYDTVKVEEDTSLQSSRNLVTQLRRQVQDLQQQSNSKDQIIQNLQKDQKLLQLRELETENQVMRGELNRLQQMLKASVALQLEFQHQDIETIIKTLQTDNIELTSIIKQLQGDLAQMTTQFKNSERQVKKLAFEKSNLQKLKLTLEKDLEDLRSKDPYQKQMQHHHQIEKQLRAELDSRFSEVNDLNNALIQKEKKIFELEGKIKDTYYENSLRVRDLESEIQNLKEKITKLEDVNNTSQLSKKNKRRTLNHQPTVFLQDIDTRKHLQSIRNLDLLLIKEQEACSSDDQDSEEMEKQYQVYTLQKEDVIDIATIIRYRLRDRKLHFKDLDQYLMETGELVSIEGLTENLNMPPFDLTQKEALLFARYLVESNEELTITYDAYATTHWARARSIIKNLMGDQIQIEPEEEENLRMMVSQHLQRGKLKIEQHLARAFNITGNQCERHQFQEAMYVGDCMFQGKAMDLLLYKNFFFCNEILHTIDLKQTFDYFSDNKSLTRQGSIMKSVDPIPLDNFTLNMNSVPLFDQTPIHKVQFQDKLQTDSDSDS